ncbi:hypothetical protein RJJ65_40540, partial [Rhizobium hidalgonense]
MNHQRHDIKVQQPILRAESLMPLTTKVLILAMLPVMVSCSTHSYQKASTAQGAKVMLERSAKQAS